MKRIVETSEDSALDALLGEKVLLMCSDYFYTGQLTGVNDTSVELSEPSIVYETGKWDAANWADVQRLHVDVWNVQRSHIESFGAGK